MTNLVAAWLFVLIRSMSLFECETIPPDGAAIQVVGGLHEHAQ
jgi:hypothetical protein